MVLSSVTWLDHSTRTFSTKKYGSAVYADISFLKFDQSFKLMTIERGLRLLFLKYCIKALKIRLL